MSETFRYNYPALEGTDYKIVINGRSIIGVVHMFDKIPFFTFIDSLTSYMDNSITDKSIHIIFSYFTIHINILNDPRGNLIL